VPETPDIHAEFLDSLRGVVREVLAEMMAAARQPAIVASESGIPSLKLNQLASGKTQPELKLYGAGALADPYALVETTFDIWDQILVYTTQHAPGEPLRLRRPS